ncbi:MAG: hypothetical protein M1832_002620 [Thelocarpon impressellum]|nr:MAG: hypothetical protein M1832_002620 [Thelocarpon impressellum]
MAQIINLGLRGFQFLWTLLIIALVGNMIREAFAGNPSMINYDMFVAVFSMLSLLYLIPATLRDSFAVHPTIMLVVDLLNTLFFFIGGVAMAAKLGVHSCGNEGYIKDNSLLNGADNKGKRCHEAQAVTAFLWFGFISYLASTVLSALSARGSGSGMSRGGIGGIRKGAPSMTQV